MKKTVDAKTAPKAIGPYCHAVAYNGLVITSGQVGFDPASGVMVPGGAAEQTLQVMKNLTSVLEAAGTGWNRVLKSTVYLVDMGDFAAVNAVYADFFTDGNYPARCCVAVKNLPANALVEIELLAAAE